jgi:hypothetical protein
MQQQATGTTWLDILQTGVQGVIDSQIAKNYAVSDPAYRTAGGTAGQAQLTGLPQVASTLAPLLVLGVLAVVAVVLVRKL